MITSIFLFGDNQMNKNNKIKNDTSFNWAKASFIPKEDEIILYNDLLKIKIGDGKTQIGELPFLENETPTFEGEFELKEVK